ncbi:MAG: DUF2314 domain-containing protein, partial [Bradyrhizobium sp.]
REDERRTLQSCNFHGDDMAFPDGDDPPIVMVRAADAEMNAAIAHARDTLPTFWASRDAPKPTETGHALKVRFEVGAKVEHIWVSDVKNLSDGNYSGRLANEPRAIC